MLLSKIIHESLRYWRERSERQYISNQYPFHNLWDYSRIIAIVAWESRDREWWEYIIFIDNSNQLIAYILSMDFKIIGENINQGINVKQIISFVLSCSTWNILDSLKVISYLSVRYNAQNSWRDKRKWELFAFKMNQKTFREESIGLHWSLTVTGTLFHWLSRQQNGSGLSGY